MSAILKALKKIERETGGTHLPAQAFRSGRHAAADHAPGRSRRAWKIFSSLVLACGIVSAGGVFLFRDHAVKSSGLGNAPPERAVAAVSPAVNPAPAIPLEKTETIPAAAPPAVPQTSATSRPKAAEPIPDAPPVRDLQEDEPTDRSWTPAPKDANLTLQALVWSEKPDERFAVINDRIVREGGTVNGSVVAGIEHDYVTLKSGGAVWRLESGHTP